MIVEACSIEDSGGVGNAANVSFVQVFLFFISVELR